MADYIERGAIIDILNAKADMAVGTPKEVFHAAAKMVNLLPAADVVELPLIIDAGYRVKIIRRDEIYGNLYSTRLMTKSEAREFLERVGELTENAKKALAERIKK